MIFPFLGALALSGGTILDRIILKKRKISIKQYLILSFFFIVIISLPFAYFHWKLLPEALSLKNILIFAAVVILAIVANLFYDYSMKWEKVGNLEPARLLESLFIVLLALLFSFIINEEIYERNLNVIIPAIVASLALVFSHIKKHHLSFNKYFIAAIFASLFFALELVISKLILDFYSPENFYFLRCLSILIISAIIFMPNFKKIDKKITGVVFITAAVWFAYRIILYYGYLIYGITFTTLIIMLGPVFVYAFAFIFLKEKLNWRNILAAVIIVACVVYVVLL
ncbi:DMT family transporter [Candidatus Pacearchaeota archaeon]|nr:DMT family transporter [Candidatus Pacearchaeota archaeon]